MILINKFYHYCKDCYEYVENSEKRESYCQNLN